MKRPIRKLLVAAVAVMALMAFAAAAASAATSVDVNAFDQLEVNAATGVDNTINIYPTSLSDYYQVVDSADTVTPGAGCVSDTANSVTCGPVLSDVAVEANDGDDYVSAYFITDQFYAYGDEGNDTLIGPGSVHSVLYGGSGTDDLVGGSAYDAILGGDDGDSISGQGGEDALWGQGDDDAILGGNGIDSIDGGDGADTINGNAGSDALTGGSGDDSIYGDADDDSLVGGPGADLLDGGSGTDLASYTDKTVGGGLVVTIDGSANDGQSSEGDNVAVSTENLTGTAFGDNLRGASTGTVSNTISGGAGADVIYGYGGGDTLTGGTSFDLVYGGDGNDTINVRDGASDSTDCGAGTDVANADLTPFDSTVTNCETVNRA